MLTHLEEEPSRPPSPSPNPIPTIESKSEIYLSSPAKRKLTVLQGNAAGSAEPYATNHNADERTLKSRPRQDVDPDDDRRRKRHCGEQTTTNEKDDIVVPLFVHLEHDGHGKERSLSADSPLAGASVPPSPMPQSKSVTACSTSCRAISVNDTGRSGLPELTRSNDAPGILKHDSHTLPSVGPLALSHKSVDAAEHPQPDTTADDGLGNHGSVPAKKKKSPHFTEAEDAIILRGYEMYGDNWDEIIRWGNLDRSVRTTISVKGRFTRLQTARKKEVPTLGASVPQNVAGEEKKPDNNSLSNHSLLSNEDAMASGLKTPARHTKSWSQRLDGGGHNALVWTNGADAQIASSLIHTPTGMSPGAKPSAQASTKKIHEYFSKTAGGSERAPVKDGNKRSRAGSREVDDGTGTDGLDSAPFLTDAPLRVSEKVNDALVKELEELRAQLHTFAQTNENTQVQLRGATNDREELQKQIQELEHERSALEAQTCALREEAQQSIANIEAQANAQLTKARLLLVDMLREKATQSGREAREKVNAHLLRLGSIKYDRHGMGFHERWEDGYALKEQHDQLNRIGREKEDIERKRKLLARRLRLTKALHAEASNNNTESGFKSDGGSLEKPMPHARTNAAGNSSSNTTQSPLEPISSGEYFELDEIAKLRLAALKREETETQVLLDKLTLQRDLHIRAWRRINDEDASRFSGHPLLNDRYLLLNLIGKGGFSEVYRAFDTIDMRHVACKLHSLNETWSEERKQSYIKHSIREYRIHKTLVHPRVVRLYDVFEYDHLSFATVMEYVCEGRDLEEYLQVVKAVCEKEARSIVTQVLGALKYLNELENPIIHYDLKPGNILYHKGEVKLTDFGLSKIVENAEPRFRTPGFAPLGVKDIELTSQGAGTYWYLPPEVFGGRRGQEPVKISSKVDVWSLGCIFYELLYGAKPFGNNQSQQTILEESTITRDAGKLEFPVKPVVSQETKDFIRRCLEYRKERRPDVLQLSNDPYVNPPVTGLKDGGSARAATK
ncbi:uncharacterized protein EV422DRAFT_243265 [Fimicolochytrium jonesii]|uniref:uncharacterized protein n=1 Tax=Fimicolochytrium jonesii TaxID=1396493 RepID=UPI0022FF4552|nr:uncharacterized protein EV422DRAFT_243265 [Fimicolochytrium jonesii]KAI8825046.1 hypothetical protein EV422DRAFT_243265 [Fimicolochytrium jonesii]